MLHHLDIKFIFDIKKNHVGDTVASYATSAIEKVKRKRKKIEVDDVV